MRSEPKAPQPSQRMLDMSLALEKLRDSWVEMSLVLGDLLTEAASQERDEVLIEVERYLARLREAER